MGEQANTTAAAEVSSEYISDIRLRVRSSVDKLDGEIKDLILAARRRPPGQGGGQGRSARKASDLDLCQGGVWPRQRRRG